MWIRWSPGPELLEQVIGAMQNSDFTSPCLSVNHESARIMTKAVSQILLGLGFQVEEYNEEYEGRGLRVLGGPFLLSSSWSAASTREQRPE